MKLYFTILFLTVSLLFAYTQSNSISGFVHNAENDSYLSAATISLQPVDRHMQADGNGFFSFDNLPAANYMLKVSFIGYNDLSVPIRLSRDTLLHLHMQPSPLLLQEVSIEAEKNGFIGIESSLPVTEIGKNYLLKNSSTNFMQTLSSVAGISSMDIGAGFSKPVIRGLGFNRVAVVDKGVVQQNQQWGADHGLDIDQFAVDGVRVHKGPMSLYYGSDAIGGVIEILPATIPQEDIFWGDATIIAKSNNDFFGASVAASRKKGNLFFHGRVTTLNYGDYRIPADTIDYLTWKMPVYGGRMKNTAGREYNITLSSNYSKNRFSSWIHVSNIYSKNGFYPGAHGIPSLDRLKHDGSVRNIELSYATSNHFKLISSNEWKLSGKNKFFLDLGYQKNRREAMSMFHTQYGNQQAPLIDPDLELQFSLNTYSGSVRYMIDENKIWSKIFGASSEYQHNRVGEYSFLLPDFERFTSGLFWINKFDLNEKITLTGGVRYDIGKLKVHDFYDPMLAEYLLMQNYSQEDSDLYALRSSNISRSFNDISGSVGFEYQPTKNHTLKLNLGKSFRYPGANELSSNGLHHGAFRHEQGNNALSSEKGYQLDIDYQFQNNKFSLMVNPFIGWFENYIYLEPTGSWSVLPHAGQIYRYNETEAIMSGGEILAKYDINNNWSINTDVEYVYNRNITDNYSLPFTPPTVVSTNVTYTGYEFRKTVSNGANEKLNGRRSLLSSYEIKLENRWVMNQSSVSRNEQSTPGALLWNISAYAHWNLGNNWFITVLQVDNIFDSAFMNHLSFYRKLNAPEPGRNIQLILKIPF